ncbi:family 43 glycosylhydrolase [Aquihabitans sp. McL0605]|uniref:family 43 glycosylhydrolase n=1 Tax=Aquihabitans sp. McL0605 TaxID=3415671 RepID=UPI003CFBBA71
MAGPSSSRSSGRTGASRRTRSALLAAFITVALLSMLPTGRAEAFTGPPVAGDLHDPMTLAAQDGVTYVTYASTPAQPIARCSASAATLWVPYIWHGNGETLALDGQCVDGDAMPNGPGDWANPSKIAGQVWAPSVVFWNNHYIMYYTARVAGSSNERCLGIAFSPNARGPFTASDTSINCSSNGRWSIDPEAFVDNGHLYLTWRDDNPGEDNDHAAISAMEMSSTGYPMLSTRQTLLKASSVSYSGPTPGENKYIIENPTLIRVTTNNTIYLFFSAYAWTSGNYVTGIANCGTSLLSGSCALTNSTAYFASGPASVPSVKSFPAGANDDPGAAAMSIFRTHAGAARVVWAYQTNYPFGDPRTRSIKAGVLSYSTGGVGFDIS